MKPTLTRDAWAAEVLSRFPTATLVDGLDVVCSAFYVDAEQVGWYDPSDCCVIARPGHDAPDTYGATDPNHTQAAEYVEPNKQILVVIGGVTFFSLPVGPTEARHLLESVKRAAPNTDPMIVVAN